MALQGAVGALDAGGKPSTWFPPGGLVEHTQTPSGGTRGTNKPTNIAAHKNKHSMHSRCKDYLKIKQTCSVTQTLNASKQAGRQATKQASTQVSEQGSKQMRMNNQASQRKTPTTKN